MKMQKKLFKLIPVLSFFTLLPFISLAANTDCATITTEPLRKIICQISALLNAMIPAMVALALLYFIWGVIQYVIAGGAEEKSEGRSVMIYGLIGLSVIVGIWGLVNIVVTTLGGPGTTPAPITAPTTVGTATCTIAGNLKPTFQDLLCYITKIINDSIIPLLFAVAVVMFIWGTINFVIINADDAEKRAQGRQFMIWGIVALAVMISVWGLVGILTTTFGIKGGSFLPQVTRPTN